MRRVRLSIVGILYQFHPIHTCVAMPELILERFESHPISETCRILGSIIAQCVPVATHVKLAISRSVLAKRVQWRIIRMTDYEL